jgi:hypothetical protein
MIRNPQSSNSSRRHWGQTLVLLVVFGLIGCYTILQHPVTSQEGPLQEDHAQEYYRQNCVSCHEDYAEYPYGYFYGVYPEYYFEYPRWGYYYAYPWWWDNHWYNDSEMEGTETTIPGPRVGRRSSLAPPYVQGAPALNTGGSRGGGYRSNSLPPSTTGQTGTSHGPASSARGEGKKRIIVTGEKKDDQDDDQNDNTEDTKKKDKKSTRRGGVPPR